MKKIFCLVIISFLTACDNKPEIDTVEIGRYIQKIMPFASVKVSSSPNSIEITLNILNTEEKDMAEINRGVDLLYKDITKKFPDLKELDYVDIIIQDVLTEKKYPPKRFDQTGN